MKLKKLAPWNWFKKEQEQEQEGKLLPVYRPGMPVYQGLESQFPQEIARLFDDFFRGFRLSRWPDFGSAFGSTFPAGWFKPTLDIGATEREYTITVELPGVEEKDIYLELANDTLVIRGEKKQVEEEKEKDFYRVERAYGSFQRVLSLPEDADQDGIQAVFKRGVLTITVPRKALPAADTKRIPIKMV
jgi:HSP20 family protein